MSDCDVIKLLYLSKSIYVPYSIVQYSTAASVDSSRVSSEVLTYYVTLEKDRAYVFRYIYRYQVKSRVSDSLNEMTSCPISVLLAMVHRLE